MLVHRLGKDNEELVVNVDQIEFVEGHLDTVLSMVNGRKIIIKESKEEVIKKVVEFRRSIMIGG
ncbi:MAG: flagellar FlbD family protein [Fusobacteriaceae bacterium]|nr:flagellar FlbD family protein [Fusobacteriaceae bacterium]MBP9595333.1 flagellar FlbD family protein [Fusobacteriaceae bacterium]MBU9916930.1 flagellar FlbD family protein [Fusobacteriaceae bacterium]